MNNECKVTIIMSSYNQACFIEQAIDSVLSQKTTFPINLIITDDCSTKDDSIKIIKRYAETYPEKITAIINDKNKGYLKNILRAKEITKTPYFCLLDADDYFVDENYLQSAVDYLDNHPDFTIYARNVICLNEDGTNYLFYSGNIQDSDYSFEDFINNNIVIPQTTGCFFRNIIFINKIPEIMTKAIGTLSERSFEGDFFRFIIHLKYGKAHYENKPNGVYRILSTGIWSRMNDFEKNITRGQAFIDFNEYFDNRYNDFFIKSAYISFKKCINNLNNISEESVNFSDESQQKFFNVLKICSHYPNIINHKENIKIKNIKYKVLLCIYEYCKKKLTVKDYIEND